MAFASGAMIGRADVDRYVQSDVHVLFRHDAGYSRRKRVLDVLIASVTLVMASPILAVAALAIWLEDRGGPIFSQERVGQYGRLFRIYKLRTMRLADCEDAISPSTGCDGRITKVGSVLRKTSIDELPQLVNVIRGDMAVVGPRPEMPFLVNRYLRWQHCRHLRKPGVTGLWQVSVRKRIPLHHPDATKIDLEYVRTASTRTDGAILLRTFLALLDPRGAF